MPDKNNVAKQCYFKQQPLVYLHALLVVPLLCQVHGGEAEAVPGEERGAVGHQQADVVGVAVLGSDVERGAALAAGAASGLGLGGMKG